MGKIEKLTRSIDKKKVEIEGYESKISEARQLLKDGRIDKDQWTRARHKYQEKIRAVRATINRKEKARLKFEKEIKEKKEDQEKKEKDERSKKKQDARDQGKQTRMDKKAKGAK